MNVGTAYDNGKKQVWLKLDVPDNSTVQCKFKKDVTSKCLFDVYIMLFFMTASNLIFYYYKENFSLETRTDNSNIRNYFY